MTTGPKGHLAEILRRGLERLSGVSPIVVPEYPLNPRPRWGWGRPVPEHLIKIFAEAEADSQETIARMLELEDWCRSVPRHAPIDDETAPHWANDYWGGLDAIVQVAELRRLDPKIYLEVGSGNSTKFARRAITDFGLQARIVSIDPNPRAEVDGLCDEVIRRPAEDVLTDAVRDLEPGDVLFIDGTHTALMNSDATVAICEVLPALPAGILVQIDDVFLPWDYPAEWANRWYGEQYLVAAYLLGGTGWRLRFPSWYLTQVSELSTHFDPLWTTVEGRFGRTANSFWFETGPASA